MNSEVSNRMIGIDSPNENGNFDDFLMKLKFSFCFVLLFLLPAMISSKNALVEPTPRKMPFKDSTNSTSAVDLLKSAVKRSEKLDIIQIQEFSLKEQSQIQEEDFDFSEFNFPKDRDCHCCGANKNREKLERR